MPRMRDRADASAAENLGRNAVLRLRANASQYDESGTTSHTMSYESLIGRRCRGLRFSAADGGAVFDQEHANEAPLRAFVFEAHHAGLQRKQ